MAIGQGQGEDKVDQAIYKALNHPLVDQISLEHASGILINFTGGDDLSLFEVNQALTELQCQANPNTEIVMGVINDQRMNGRVQAILIVTGLGARTLEEVLPGAEKLHIRNEPEPAPTSVSELLHTHSEVERPAIGQIPAANDLDLPAFMRRERYSGHAFRNG